MTGHDANKLTRTSRCLQKIGNKTEMNLVTHAPPWQKEAESHDANRGDSERCKVDNSQHVFPHPNLN